MYVYVHKQYFVLVWLGLLFADVTTVGEKIGIYCGIKAYRTGEQVGVEGKGTAGHLVDKNGSGLRN